MITAEVLVSSHAAAGPSEGLRPIIEELLQVPLKFLAKHLLKVVDLLDEYTTPAHDRVIFVFVEVPSDELELSLVDTPVFTCAIAVIPFPRFLAVGFVGRPVVALAAFVLHEERAGFRPRAVTRIAVKLDKERTQYRGPLHLPQRFRSFHAFFSFLQ